MADKDKSLEKLGEIEKAARLRLAELEKEHAIALKKLQRAEKSRAKHERRKTVHGLTRHSTKEDHRSASLRSDKVNKSFNDVLPTLHENEVDTCPQKRLPKAHSESPLMKKKKAVESGNIAGRRNSNSRSTPVRFGEQPPSKSISRQQKDDRKNPNATQSEATVQDCVQSVSDCLLVEGRKGPSETKIETCDNSPLRMQENVHKANDLEEAANIAVLLHMNDAQNSPKAARFVDENHSETESKVEAEHTLVVKRQGFKNASDNAKDHTASDSIVGFKNTSKDGNKKDKDDSTEHETSNESKYDSTAKPIEQRVLKLVSTTVEGDESDSLVGPSSSGPDPEKAHEFYRRIVQNNCDRDLMDKRKYHGYEAGAASGVYRTVTPDDARAEEAVDVNHSVHHASSEFINDQPDHAKEVVDLNNSKQQEVRVRTRNLSQVCKVSDSEDVEAGLERVNSLHELRKNSFENQPRKTKESSTSGNDPQNVESSDCIGETSKKRAIAVLAANSQSEGSEKIGCVTYKKDAKKGKRADEKKDWMHLFEETYPRRSPRNQSPKLYSEKYAFEISQTPLSSGERNESKIPPLGRSEPRRAKKGRKSKRIEPSSQDCSLSPLCAARNTSRKSISIDVQTKSENQGIPNISKSSLRHSVEQHEPSKIAAQETIFAGRSSSPTGLNSQKAAQSPAITDTEDLHFPRPNTALWRNGGPLSLVVDFTLPDKEFAKLKLDKIKGKQLEKGKENLLKTQRSQTESSSSSQISIFSHKRCPENSQESRLSSTSIRNENKTESTLSDIKENQQAKGIGDLQKLSNEVIPAEANNGLGITREQVETFYSGTRVSNSSRKTKKRQVEGTDAKYLLTEVDSTIQGANVDLFSVISRTTNPRTVGEILENKNDKQGSQTSKGSKASFTWSPEKVASKDVNFDKEKKPIDVWIDKDNEEYPDQGDTECNENKDHKGGKIPNTKYLDQEQEHSKRATALLTLDQYEECFVTKQTPGSSEFLDARCEELAQDSPKRRANVNACQENMHESKEEKMCAGCVLPAESGVGRSNLKDSSGHEKRLKRAESEENLANTPGNKLQESEPSIGDAATPFGKGTQPEEDDASATLMSCERDDHLTPILMQACLQHDNDRDTTVVSICQSTYDTSGSAMNKRDVIAVCLPHGLILWICRPGLEWTVLNTWTLDEDSGERFCSVEFLPCTSHLVLVAGGNFSETNGRIFGYSEDGSYDFELISQDLDIVSPFLAMCVLPSDPSIPHPNVECVIGGSSNGAARIVKWSLDSLCLKVPDWFKLPCPVDTQEVTSLLAVEGSRCLLLGGTRSCVLLWNHTTCCLLKQINLVQDLAAQCLQAETNMGLLFVTVADESCSKEEKPKLSLLASNPKNGRMACLQSFVCPSSYSVSASYAYNQFVAFGLSSGAVYMWNKALPSSTAEILAFQGAVSSISIHPCKPLVAFGDRSGCVHLYSLC